MSDTRSQHIPFSSLMINKQSWRTFIFNIARPPKVRKTFRNKRKAGGKRARPMCRVFSADPPLLAARLFIFFLTYKHFFVTVSHARLGGPETLARIMTRVSRRLFSRGRETATVWRPTLRSRFTTSAFFRVRPWCCPCGPLVLLVSAATSAGRFSGAFPC